MIYLYRNTHLVNVLPQPPVFSLHNSEFVFTHRISVFPRLKIADLKLSHRTFKHA